jgi:hypothetical protein
MNIGQSYEIIKRIKVHTKPLVTCDVILTGKFEKETKMLFVFDNFKVRKNVIVSIKEK